MSWLTDAIKTVAVAAAIVYTGGAAAAALGTGTLAAAAVNFGARVLATMVVSSLFTRKPDNPSGDSVSNVPGRQQVSANTANKLPVTYGSAFLSPIIVDAKISNDQQYMWYVLAFSEVTDTGTITYDDPSNPGFPLMYWADKKLQFDTTDRTKVTGFIEETTSSPTTDTSVNGKMYVYFYNNGSDSGLYNAPSAITVLSDTSTGGGIPIDQRWNNFKQMYKTAFCIIRIKYDQENSLLTGMQKVTTRLTNTLDEPGSVMVDYLLNERYGCGISSDLVDVAAFTELDSYSSEMISFNDNGTTKEQYRYRINGPVDTSSDCLKNLQSLAEASDSWLQWNETKGQWSVVINRSFSQAGLDISDLFTIYCDTIQADTNSTTYAPNFAYAVGGIDITPMDLNSTYNHVEVQFPNKYIKDQTDYAYIDLPTELLNPNEPINKFIITLPQVNNNVQAEYIGTRQLSMARDDLIISVTTDYSGIQVDAGDIVRVYHSYYGWNSENNFNAGKLFRVTQVQEVKTDGGILGARITMSEYNDTIYGDGDITAFQPAENTGLTDPNVITVPGTPLVSNYTTSATIPNFTVTVSAQSYPSGQVQSLEFWYCLASSPPTDITNFKLWETQYYSNGPIYPKNYTQTITVTGLPASPAGFQYYWRVRAAGTRSKSGFSANSIAVSWNPNPTATVTGQNFQTVFEPNPVSVNRFANGQPDLSNVYITMYGVLGAGQVNFNGTQSNSLLGTNEWRIDNANIVTSGITIGHPTDEGGYALFPAPSQITANVATISVPTIYKDDTGNLFQVPTSILTVNTLMPGTPGTRGVVTLAYVPVTYDPTTSNIDVQLSTSFFTTTGFEPPIENDAAVFYNSSTNTQSQRRYNPDTTPKWQYATLEVPGQVITGKSISTSQIVNNAITSELLSNSSVTSQKIAANAVVANNIVAGSITAIKIAANAITSDKIAAGSITTDKLSADLVFTGNIQSINSVFGDPQSAGFWMSSNGTARFGSTVSVGDLIADGTLKANTVTTEQLVIGSVTQSRSSKDTPDPKIVPYYNGGSNWPVNTRGFPVNSVTIIPTTDPNQSANVEYTEGSRIQVGISASIFSGVNGDSGNLLYQTYNCMELWRSGASSVYTTGALNIRHSYDITSAQNHSQTIHAYGVGGFDYVSTDGGETWNSYTNASTTKTINGTINYYYDYGSNKLLNTAVVGPMQVGDGGTGTLPTSNWGQRGISLTSPIPLKFAYATYVSALNNYLYQSYNSIEVTPYTGGNKAYGTTYATSLGAFAVGNQGTILFNPSTGGSIGAYNGWISETTNTLQNLYAIYSSNYQSGSKNYTAIAVGGTGTVLRSQRTWSSSSYSWTSLSITTMDGVTPLLNDLYGIASDNENHAGTTWVAVGKYGTVITSYDDGQTWTQYATPTPDTLRSVRFGNGKFVAVGDNGVIITSTDGAIWTQVNSSVASGKKLNSIDYSSVYDRFNIGGEGVLLTSSGTNINFVVSYQWSPAETYSLERIWYRGSWPLTSTTTEPAPENRIRNGETVSVTIVDTGYKKGQETTYYLVVGNLRGNSGATTWSGGAFLSVTEYKR